MAGSCAAESLRPANRSAGAAVCIRHGQSVGRRPCGNGAGCARRRACDARGRRLAPRSPAAMRAGGLRRLGRSCTGFELVRDARRRCAKTSDRLRTSGDTLRSSLPFLFFPSLFSKAVCERTIRLPLPIRSRLRARPFPHRLRLRNRRKGLACHSLQRRCAKNVQNRGFPRRTHPCASCSTPRRERPHYRVQRIAGLLRTALGEDSCARSLR